MLDKPKINISLFHPSLSNLTAHPFLFLRKTWLVMVLVSTVNSQNKRQSWGKRESLLSWTASESKMTSEYSMGWAQCRYQSVEAPRTNIGMILKTDTYYSPCCTEQDYLLPKVINNQEEEEE